MAHKAVFLDRDGTLIEDPGYLAERERVRLLPGAAQALKALVQGGYRLVVVSNQSGIARGLLTVEDLEAIHAEIHRQLAEQGASLDAIYYCPYHPEGVVEPYVRASDERKPSPGMLLRAAREMELDLAHSWMVGDSPRDVEAGQRAGCRTVRLRSPGSTSHDVAGTDEDVQADFTVRDLAEAARIILHQEATLPAATLPIARPSRLAAAPAGPPREAPAPAAGAAGRAENLSEREALNELLKYARQMARLRQQVHFSVTKLIAGVCQGLALLCLGIGALRFISLTSPAEQANRFWLAMGWLAIAAVIQLIALTFFLMNRSES